jgi:hypothetical protein
MKYIALQLCTCSWLETMTATGIILYLLYLQSNQLAIISLAVFAPLIGFHFAVSKMSKLEDCKCIKKSQSNLATFNPRLAADRLKLSSVTSCPCLNK